MNVIDITNPLEKKRQTYLTFYKDGMFDGILNQKPDPRNNSSAYYKKGFSDGLKLLELIKDYKIGGN